NCATDPTPPRCAKLQFFFDKFDHPILIESTVRINVGVVPTTHIELTGGFCLSRINARRLQPLEVILTAIGIDDMESSIPAHESLFDEWKKRPVFFFGATEESTDMPFVAKLGACKANGGGVRIHGSSFQRIVTGCKTGTSISIYVAPK